MDEHLTISIDSSLLYDAIQAVEQIGLDLHSALRIFITRLAREQSLSFLFLGNTQSQTGVPNRERVPDNFQMPHSKVREQGEKGDVTKSKALSLFRNAGVNFNRNVTFASKNRTAFNYWANPEFGMLKDDWFIVFNDWIKRELHLFFIPANSINASELTPRSDKEWLIDLQIMYNDNSFRDNRSGYCFAKHLIKQIKY
ncbi:MAG: hypothetical protein FWE84_05220 [Firmicutes bacterium]|nr:hypothetical protein [Bacillota bacterium]